MLENIHLTYDVIFSGRVLQELIDHGYSREKAYDLIQPIAFEAMNRKISFLELLKKTEVINVLSEEEINQCFDLHYYLKNIDNIYKRLGW